MKKLLAVLALALGSAAFAADQAPLFNATLTIGKEHRFVLIDATGKASAFLALGESFAGYKLKAYDPKTSALDLEKDGQVTRVALMADAAIGNAPATVTKATVADAEAVLGKMRFEEMMERAMQGQRKMLAAQFQRMGAQMKSQGVPEEEAMAFQKKLTDEIFGAMDPKVLKNDVSKIYSEVFTKQELDQLGAFYSTPVGEMLTNKQPEVQEKLGAIIQGRMMEVMPRVQQMSRDFMLEQRAKREATKAAAAPTPAPTPAPTTTP